VIGSNVAGERKPSTRRTAVYAVGFAVAWLILDAAIYVSRPESSVGGHSFLWWAGVVATPIRFASFYLGYTALCKVSGRAGRSWLSVGLSLVIAVLIGLSQLASVFVWEGLKSALP